jgi:hypothetical protein
MTRARFKKVLLVAPEVYGNQLITDYENVTHVNELNRLFPCIYESNPNLIVFDYDYLSADIEKIVRRIRTNVFYNKIKICCYKSKVEPKADDLLKAIGVDYFIYEEESRSVEKSDHITFLFTEIFERSSVLSRLISTPN